MNNQSEKDRATYNRNWKFPIKKVPPVFTCPIELKKDNLMSSILFILSDWWGQLQQWKLKCMRIRTSHQPRGDTRNKMKANLLSSPEIPYHELPTSWGQYIIHHAGHYQTNKKVASARVFVASYRFTKAQHKNWWVLSLILSFFKVTESHFTTA